MFDARKSTEYEIISKLYGTDCAKRSGVPLINHINEGLDVLIELGASEAAQRAFCLHPVVQDDLNLRDHRAKLVGLDTEVVMLTLEYRHKANSYLCRPHTDGWTQDDVQTHVGRLLPDVANMLIADKRQNQKDFRIHHLGTHIRRNQLEYYFNNWLEYLCGTRWRY